MDFGTYHHSSLRESEILRENVREEFSRLLPALFPIDSRIRILDAGCGLGFMSYVAGRIFPNANIVGIDTFNDDSLPESSIEKARKNITLLGLDDRVIFQKQNILGKITLDVSYDLVVSNLVFHNLGKRRFKAYGNIIETLKNNGYFVIGDLFPNEIEDSNYLESKLKCMRKIAGEGEGKWKYKIMVFKNDIRS